MRTTDRLGTELALALAIFVMLVIASSVILRAAWDRHEQFGTIGRDRVPPKIVWCDRTYERGAGSTTRIGLSRNWSEGLRTPGGLPVLVPMCSRFIPTGIYVELSGTYWPYALLGGP